MQCQRQRYLFYPQRPKVQHGMETAFGLVAVDDIEKLSLFHGINRSSVVKIERYRLALGKPLAVGRNQKKAVGPGR